MDWVLSIYEYAPSTDAACYVWLIVELLRLESDVSLKKKPLFSALSHRELGQRRKPSLVCDFCTLWARVSSKGNYLC